MKPSDAGLFLRYVQLLDSALPIGGFSHSFGLETYVQQGVVTNARQLEEFLLGQLHASLARLDGLAIKGVYGALDRNDPDEAARYDIVVHVQRAARESREAARSMGRRLLKLGTVLYPDAELETLDGALKRGGAYGTLPIVFAWISRKLQVDLDDAVRSYLYTSVQTLVGSALRLMPLGQTEGQSLIARMLGAIDGEWAAVRHLPPEELHAFAAAHDVRAMQHESLYSRLFMS